MTDRPGISPQAAAMLDRVSPEGRERARKERERRQAASNRLIARCLFAGLLIAALAGLASLFVPVGAAGIAAAIVLFALASAGIAIASREPPTDARGLGDSRLAQLPGLTARWLEQQRPALPAPAAELADGITLRLDAISPQLARLPEDEPAAQAVRKLIAIELPRLIEGHQAVPASLRARQRDDGESPDSHLVRGLTLVDGEIARMTEQLARGAFDEVATQHRYLELKYEGGALE